MTSLLGRLFSPRDCLIVKIRNIDAGFRSLSSTLFTDRPDPNRAFGAESRGRWDLNRAR